MRIATTLFLLIFFSSFCSAQKEISHWLLNDQNRIKINNDGTVTNQPAPNLMFGNESASIADSAGNLLFFSNGFKVFDKNLVPMPALANIDLTGNFNLKIAPYPGQPNKYYLFYTNIITYPSPYTLKYAVIDMSLNGGLGDVTTYNNVIDTLISPMFTLVNKEGTGDFWLITHRNQTDSFFSRLVTSVQINPTPVISVAGMNSVKTEYSFLDLRPSHDGKMIAGFTYTNYSGLFAYTVSFMEVFNFNSSTGLLSNKVKTMRLPGYFIGNGQVEFSPDNKLLYVLNSVTVSGLQPCGFGSSSLTQYNTCYTDSVTFTNNSMTVGNTFSFCVLIAWGRMQMGPDKKIYMPYAGTSTLSRLEFPNRLGSSSQINFPFLTLNWQTGGIVPKFYHKYVEKAVKNNITYSGGCYPAPTNFKVTNDTITDIAWNFGDPASGAANTSTLLQPQHLFSSPGIYTVTARLNSSTGNLIETITELVEIKDPGKRLLDGYPADTSFCAGNSLKLKLSVVNGIFKWSRRFDDVVYTLQIGDSIYIDGSGTYYVEMMQNDCNGCHMIDSIHVNVLPVPSVGFSDFNICAGDSARREVYDPGVNCVWSTGETTPGIWIHNGGTYWVNAEINNNGCARSDTFVVTIVPPVNFSFSADTTLCNNQTLLLSPGVPNAFYYWQNGSTSNSFLVTQPGTYWVRVASQNGCSKSDTIHVSYVNAENVNLGADINSCMGDSIHLEVNISNASYLWSTGETTPGITVHSSGNYWIKADNGACTASDTINIVFNPKPSIFLGIDTALCAHQTLTLHATTTNATYQWQNNSTLDTFVVQQPGLYWSQVTVNGCSTRDSILVNYKPLPFLNLGNDTSICINKTLLLNAGHPSVQSYAWQDNSTQPTYLITQAGTYYLNVLGMNGCSNRDTIIVSSKPLPVFSLGRDSILCDQQTLNLNISLNNSSYLWNTGSPSNSITISQAGIYWLDVTQNGCQKRDSIIIVYKPVPIIDLGIDTVLCEGSSKLLNAAYPGATYLWQNSSVTPTFQVNQPGLYYVTVNLNGCTDKDSIQINYNYKPVVNLGNDALICKGQQIILDPGVVNGNLLWQNGSAAQTFTVTAAGVYQVTATNSCGSNSDQIVITQSLCKLFMPNSFTPDNDGLNDIFAVKYPEFIKDFDMKIYNRWGEIVYSSRNPHLGWNGKYKNADQPTGNYIWMITLTDYDGNKESAKGYVLLLK
jgi:gliding motility-associated-like protein